MTHSAAAHALEASKHPFGRTPDGCSVDIFTLKNCSGMTVKVISYGGIITELLVPTRDGQFKNIVLGFDNLDQYVAEHPYFGALIGRYANRIAGAQFELNGKTYKLAANNGKNTLHGGKVGFDKKIWDAERGIDATKAWLKLHLISHDMEEGFPGRVDVTVTYELDNDNGLTIRYLAKSDQPTPINLTNHSYFNLAGAGSGNIHDHVARFNVGSYTPVNDELIPTGEIASVENTPFDFRSATKIGARINDIKGGGYDHNLVIDGKGMREMGSVFQPSTGIHMSVLTDQPGVQFYTGNFLDGSLKGNGGAYNKHGAFCLETQHFPDSVHHANFPSVILNPGETFESTTRYQFKIADGV